MSISLFKKWQALLTLLGFMMVFSSFYFQYMQGLEPCPLCLMQRLSAILLFMVSFLSVYVSTIKRARILTVFQFFIAAFGLFFAIRQLWLQSLPVDQMPACMPGLDVLIRYFPLEKVVHALLWGTGDCGEVSWQWLGLTMPAWTALFFSLFLLMDLIFYFFLDPLKKSRNHE